MVVSQNRSLLVLWWSLLGSPKVILQETSSVKSVSSRKIRFLGPVKDLHRFTSLMYQFFYEHPILDLRPVIKVCYKKSFDDQDEKLNDAWNTRTASYPSKKLGGKESKEDSSEESLAWKLKDTFLKKRAKKRARISSLFEIFDTEIGISFIQGTSIDRFTILQYFPISIDIRCIKYIHEQFSNIEKKVESFARAVFPRVT